MKSKQRQPKIERGARSARSQREGASIVEALVALSLFAVFVTGACKMLLSHRQMSDMAREHYTAVNIAKNRIELARTFEFGQIGDFMESKVLVDSSGFPDTYGNYRRSTRATKISDNLYELVINVEIRDRKTLAFDGTGQELMTYFAEYLTEDSSVGGGVTPNST